MVGHQKQSHKQQQWGWMLVSKMSNPGQGLLKETEVSWSNAHVFQDIYTQYIYLRLYICIVLVQSYSNRYLMFLTAAGRSGSWIPFRTSLRIALSFTSVSAHTSAAYLFCRKMIGFTFQTPTLILFLKENLVFKKKIISENLILHF